jgi:hypothetical protein
MRSQELEDRGAQEQDHMTEEEKVERYLSTPAGFAEGVLGFTLHPWQRDVVNEFSDLHGRVKIACSTPNGAGKSSLVNATIILRTLAVKPQAKVIVTSGDFRQIDNQLWPALERHFGKFQGWFARRHDHFIQTAEGGFATCFTTDDPRRAEGYHAQFDDWVDSPCLIICDEAKSIDESIFEAFSARCTFNGLFYVSSTGTMLGQFYEAMCGKRGFKRYSIGLHDCPHIPQQRIDELMEEYADNPNHPLLLSTLHGQFMDFTGDAGRFVTMADINRAIASPPQPKFGDLVAACDFAGGGSENVLAVRRGNKVRLIRCWKEHDEMAAIGQFITLFREQKLQPEAIFGDSAGAGKPMISRFHEVGWPINKFNGGNEAYRSSDYMNRNAEVWQVAGDEIKRGRIDLDPDQKLHMQMVDRFRSADSKGRIMAESKRDMAKRNVDSPDRADAVMMAIAIHAPALINKDEDMVRDWSESLKNDIHDDLYKNLPSGMDIGNQ